MKFVWEEKDIEGGVRYSRPDINEIWIISWGVDPHGGGEKTFSSTSLADGMVTEAITKKAMVEMLNRASYVPHKFMTESLR
jgi:hypothetical protein